MRGYLRGLGPTISLEASEYGVARGAGDVVQFDVEAEICLVFVGVVGLAVTLVGYGVRCKH